MYLEEYMNSFQVHEFASLYDAAVTVSNKHFPILEFIVKYVKQLWTRTRGGTSTVFKCYLLFAMCYLYSILPDDDILHLSAKV